MPSPRAIIKKSKRKEDWKSARQEWPEVGQTVDVIATIMCTAKLLSAKPHREWLVKADETNITEIKFWKEIGDIPKPTPLPDAIAEYKIAKPTKYMN